MTDISVKLVSQTRTEPDYQKSCDVPRSTEGLTAYITRVSSPYQQNPEFKKLLAYCLKHHHVSVFEHHYMTMDIRAPRAITAQILRHRSFTFQEFSQRYAEVTDEPILVEAREQDPKNRQKSVPSTNDDLKEWWKLTQEDAYEALMADYKQALAMGIAKEQARFLLPGAAPSRIFMTGNVRSWMHYIALRSGNGTQAEHQEIANQAKNIFVHQLPTISEALEWA